MTAGTGQNNFLRGYQMTDGNGTVQFTTIYPGWYVAERRPWRSQGQGWDNRATGGCL